MTPPDSPTTSDGGPRLHKKKKVLLIAGMQISIITHMHDAWWNFLWEKKMEWQGLKGLNNTSPLSCSYKTTKTAVIIILVSITKLSIVIGSPICHVISAQSPGCPITGIQCPITKHYNWIPVIGYLCYSHIDYVVLMASFLMFPTVFKTYGKQYWLKRSTYNKRLF